MIDSMGSVQCSLTPNGPFAGKDFHNLSTSGERIVDRAAAAPASDKGCSDEKVELR
jgi:hypothetical protein